MACNIKSQASSSAKKLSSIDLYIECTNLKDVDIFSKSDPMAVLFLTQGKQHTEIGRTETIKNSLNPKFAKPIRVDYFFEEVQTVIIKIYDSYNKILTLTDDNFLGGLECTLGTIVTHSPFTTLLRNDGDKRSENGKITVQAYPADDEGDCVELTFEGKKLDKKDVFSKSDPFLEIFKETQRNQWQLIYRSEVIKNNQNPKWRAVSLSLITLCDGDKTNRIKIDCHDNDDNGSHDYIGGCITDLEGLMKPSSGKSGFSLINPKKAKEKKRYINSGALYVKGKVLQSMKERTFLDFVFGGLNMNFTIGIDFTQSNGDPKQCNSLHHINPIVPNEYMSAIRAVGNICQDYDSDNLFPAFGFGAKIPPAMEVSNNFPINLNCENPNCEGIDGVLAAYVNCLQHIELHGPTIVNTIINNAARFAEEAQRLETDLGPNSYQVFLLLTDGVFNDMLDTRKAIIRASGLPLSLIIVGVGEADFKQIRELSGENGVLTLLDGETTKRDIVQFVPYRDFKQRSSEDLAKHVLAKIPNQVTDYFKIRGLNPNIPRSAKYIY